MGHAIGGGPTFLILVAFAVAGVYLAQREGRRVWREAQQLLSRGEVPSGVVMDGLCIVAGGILMVIPGFFSDVLGLLLVVPITRRPIRIALGLYLRRKIERGELRFGRFR